MWELKARERLQTKANQLFNEWAKTKQGIKWKNRKTEISPYNYGFSLPDYHHDLIEALNNEQEEQAKAILLTHYI